VFIVLGFALGAAFFVRAVQARSGEATQERLALGLLWICLAGISVVQRWMLRSWRAAGQLKMSANRAVTLVFLPGFGVCTVVVGEGIYWLVTGFSRSRLSDTALGLILVAIGSARAIPLAVGMPAALRRSDDWSAG